MKDTAISELIKKESIRQNTTIELIASENYVSKDIQEAVGSILTNKYAEGYPFKRYYQGTKFVDEIEELAINRLKKLFNVKYANVQPHSGSSANAAAIASLINPGEKLLAMSLDSGGHLSHGYKISFSGVFYDAYTYTVDSKGLIDYEAVLKIAKKVKPKLIICGYSAYPRFVNFEKFRAIADEVGAFLLADIAHIAGLIAANLHPSPVGHAHLITSTVQKTLRGARGGIIMTNDEDLAIKVNRWVFPGYQGGPLMHVIAGKAIAFKEAMTPGFKDYQKQVLANAKAFSNEFIKLGVEVISGGTDNHLFTINVKKTYNLTGKAAALLLEQNNISSNKNTIPFDEEKPFVTSGVRFGTPAMTTRGFKENEFKLLANAINSILKNEITSETLKIINELIKKIKIVN